MKIINEKIWIGMLVALITTLGLMATDIYAPAMPAVTQDLLTSANIVQLTVTFFLIAAGLSQLIYGPVSDHFGRRPILIFGLGVYLIGSLLCTIATHIPLLLLGRFIQGMGVGAIMALNRVIVRDSFSGTQLIKAISYIGAVIAIAPAVAPALGGFIEIHLGWRWIFGFLLVYGFGLSTLAWFTLPETHHKRPSHPLSLTRVMLNYVIILKNSQFWANVICSGLAFAAMITCATINPFLLENGLGMSAATYGLWAMISAVGFFLGMISNAHIIGRLGIEGTLRVGNSIILAMGFVFIIMGYLHLINIATVIIPTIGIEFGIALVFPNAFMGAITPFPQMTGAAGAIYGCLQVAITFACSIIVALLNESSQLPMGVLLLTIGFLGLVIYSLLKKPHWEPAVASPSNIE